jgi:hypothetical protein
MLDFVGQACTQEFKDKNKPSKHRVQDCWLQWPQVSWTDVSEHMGIFLSDASLLIAWTGYMASFEQLDVQCSVQYSKRLSNSSNSCTSTAQNT